MKLPQQRIFEIDFSSQLNVTGPLAELILAQWRSDARALGNMMEDLLGGLFEDITKKEDNDFYDMDGQDGEKIEVRTISKSTPFSFESSSNSGKGRDGTNPEDTEKKLNHVTDWLFVETINFPKCKVHRVSGEEARELMKTRKEGLRKSLTQNQFKKLRK